MTERSAALALGSGSSTEYVARLHAALPQTQCTRCGYPNCSAYAEAIAEGSAAINRCPPGGAEGIRRLAAITGCAPIDLDLECGAEEPRSVARVQEAWCIGCTLCIDACPTDAILGANKRMHTVITQHCTGCELCIPVCPVDCITLDPVSEGRTGWNAWSAHDAANALQRYERHMERQTQSPERVPENFSNLGRTQVLLATSASETSPGAAINEPSAEMKSPDQPASRRQALIEAAQKRARERQSKARL